jgi:predicted nucleic acid-binding Zn ribbon protein
MKTFDFDAAVVDLEQRQRRDVDRRADFHRRGVCVQCGTRVNQARRPGSRFCADRCLRVSATSRRRRLRAILSVTW